MKNLKKWSIALSFLSGFFYFIPFLFPSFFFLSWFALVPLLLAIQGQSYKKVYFLGFVEVWLNSRILLDGKSESAGCL